MTGMAQSKKTKTFEVLAFQSNNIEKFLGDNFVLFFVFRRQIESSFYMEPKSKNSDQRRLRDCYWGIESFHSMKVENR